MRRQEVEKKRMKTFFATLFLSAIPHRLFRIYAKHLYIHIWKQSSSSTIE